MMVIFMKTYPLVGLLFFLCSTQSLECTNPCINGGACDSFNNGSICSCPDEFSGARCESRSRYAPLIFLCDSGGSFIFESTADVLEFHSLPLPNLRQPVAVGYDFDDDVVFWVNAEDGSLNRAKRNGSGYDTLDAGHDVIDLAIHVPSKKVAWINVHRNLSGLFDYSSGLQGKIFAGNNFSTVAAHPNGNFYVIDNAPSNADIHILNNSFNPIATNVTTRLTSARSLVFNRQGTRLFIIDDQKETIESFGPLGEGQVTLFRTERTLPVDIAWYRGIPLWTDSNTRGVTLLNGHRGVSPASTNIIHFVNPTGIHVYHGQSYSKRPDERCLANEVTCGDLCIPSAWQCDGLVDCLELSDETNCNPAEDSGSLMFLTSLSGGAIYVAHTNSLNFRQLPFLFVQKPVAVGYDVIAKEVYWTDVERKTLSAARIDGSNQRIIAQGLGVPDGLFVDSDSETIFWTDTDFKTIESIQFDGSNQRILINDVDMPRAIIIVPDNRKLYWTDWGSTPKIEMSNRDGSGRQVILDTDIEWPNGITYDMQGTRLIWCDARLDKIESCDLDGGGRKILLGITHGNFHPFGVIVYEGTVMWSDWVLQGVGIEEADNQTWPGLYKSFSIIAQPSGFHVVAITCALPIESEDSHIEDPKGLYTSGEHIIIKCNNDETARTTWICNASSGYWDVTENLECPESPRSHTSLSIAIASGIAIFAVLVVTAFGVFAYIKRRKQPPVNNGNIPEQQDRGPLPRVPPNHEYMETDEDQHYYSGISNPSSMGHIYMTNLVDGKANTQRDSHEDQPRYSFRNPTF